MMFTGFKPGAHQYTSTACHHEQHGRCRYWCKFCEARCQCPCHREEGRSEPA